MIIYQAREEKDIATCEMFFDSMSKKHPLAGSIHDSLIVPFYPRAWKSVIFFTRNFALLDCSSQRGAQLY